MKGFTIETDGDGLGHASVLRRLEQDYRAAAVQYREAALQLEAEADKIKDNDYTAPLMTDDELAELHARWRNEALYRQRLDKELKEEEVEIDESDLVAVRKAAAEPLDLMDHLYVGMLEDKGFTYEECEEICEYFKEIIGAYKIEYDWGCTMWVDVGGSDTGFSYTLFKDEDEEAPAVWPETPPVTIRFDLDDLRRAARGYARSYDEYEDDGSSAHVRKNVLDLLHAWSDCIATLIIEVEDELKGYAQ